MKDVQEKQEGGEMRNAYLPPTGGIRNYPLPHDAQKMEDYWQHARRLLMNYPVSVIDVSSYRCYVMELYAAQRRYAGEVLAIECVTRVAKYVAQGLEQEILEEIRDKVFGVHAPTP